jgi:hypothetical protein
MAALILMMQRSYAAETRKVSAAEGRSQNPEFRRKERKLKAVSAFYSGF